LTESEHRHHDLVLAIRALGTIREERALERLRELVLAAQTHPAIRLEAAGALGSLRADGLEKDATRLTADPLSRTSDARLAAVSLLRQHRSPEAVQLLQRLTGNDEPSVAAGAAARLLEIDSKLLIPSLGTMLANPDSKVRSVGVEVLFRNPSEKHIELLGFGMDDVHPDVRMQARRSLHDLAKRNLREAVIAEGTRRLATGQWRALEQAAILLAQLDHKKASERLVQLLRDGRPEVFVAAAWGLRKLAVPETLPRALRHVEYRLKQLSTALERADSKPLPTEMIDHQLSQLNQFLGQHKYPPAEPVLRRFIPQPNRNMRLGHESRAAAIWALGLIHEGKNDPELATALEERLNHTGMPIPPEDRRVRWMCAIALGRMQAKATLPSLRKHYLHLQPSDDRVNNACGWAIEQIAGEVVPPPRTIRKVQRDWFLTPRE
jgi:HEAT repeat protein